MCIVCGALYVIYFDFNRQRSYDMYKFIDQFWPFKFNSNLILWWEETDGAVKHWVIAIVAYLVRLLITHGGGLPVDQLFLWRMVVSPLGITRVINALVCI